MSAWSISPIHIEQLGDQHEIGLKRLLLSLDQASRCDRFDFAANDAYLIAYAKQMLAAASWLAGAFVDGELRGIVELHRDKHRSEAEAAFVVDAGWRRRGLGTALLQAAIDWAAGNDVTMVRMIFSRHNWPMRKLASKARARLDLVLGEMCAEVLIGKEPVCFTDEIYPFRELCSGHA